jgi:hypothetical protein
MLNKCAAPVRDRLLIDLVNLSAKDQAFFTAVVKLFCDPAWAEAAEDFRTGKAALEYEPFSGDPALCRAGANLQRN